MEPRPSQMGSGRETGSFETTRSCWSTARHIEPKQDRGTWGQNEVNDAQPKQIGRELGTCSRGQVNGIVAKYITDHRPWIRPARSKVEVNDYVNDG
uniref:Uncharacterized protein n=1 Tax=Tanacetum cinerariifolium TaxID=118510 RepID=A0A699R8K5_TANCI|nr:hypothetical protein [Tanacetum cinerariifolium]